MEKLLEVAQWDCKFSEAGYQDITRADRPVLAKLMEIQS